MISYSFQQFTACLPPFASSILSSQKAKVFPIAVKQQLALVCELLNSPPFLTAWHKSLLVIAPMIKV